MTFNYFVNYTSIKLGEVEISRFMIRARFQNVETTKCIQFLKNKRLPRYFS